MVFILKMNGIEVVIRETESVIDSRCEARDRIGDLERRGCEGRRLPLHMIGPSADKEMKMWEKRQHGR